MLLGVLLATCGPAPANRPQASPTAAVSPNRTEASAQAPSSWWRPEPGSRWQIQFTGEVIEKSGDAVVYELDLFDTTSELVAEFHDEGKRVVCYLNAGSWEDWRLDAENFPEEILGNDYEGWPGERWLDIRSEALRPILEARLNLCTAKGFDGVDPDNVDGYSNETASPSAARSRWPSTCGWRRRRMHAAWASL